MSIFQLFVMTISFGISVGVPPSIMPHPTVVHVLYHEHKTCDGSILSENIIMTAAHCIIGYWHKRVQVMVSDGQDRSIYNVTSIKYHKDYNPISGTGDIALLRLKNRIDPKHDVVLIHVPTERMELVSNDSQCLAYRWTQGGRPGGDMIISASVDPIVSLTECARSYGKPVESLRGLFCAKSGKLRSIREATGGPVLMNQQQVGIVISQRPIGLKPILFMDVTVFLSWINETIQQVTNCHHSSTSFYPLPKEALALNAEYRGEPVHGVENISTVAVVNATSGKLKCIGNIVSSNLVLTTARCVRRRWKEMRARVISRNGVRGLDEHTIVRVYRRKDFDITPLPHVHDVALLRVEPPFTFHHGMKEVEIASWRDSIQPLMTGWIYGLAGGPDIRRLEALVIDHEECSWIYRKRGGVNNGTICASTYHGICNHIPGEPLIIRNQLFGILAGTPEECGDFRYPAVFIDVISNFDWIQLKISQNRKV